MGGFVEANCKNLVLPRDSQHSQACTQPLTCLFTSASDRYSVVACASSSLVLESSRTSSGRAMICCFVFGEAQGQRVVSKWRGDTLTEPSLPAALIRVPRLAH